MLSCCEEYHACFIVQKMAVHDFSSCQKVPETFAIFFMCSDHIAQNVEFAMLPLAFCTASHC